MNIGNLFPLLSAVIWMHLPFKGFMSWNCDLQWWSVEGAEVLWGVAQRWVNTSLSFWAIVTSEPLFHRLTPSFLLCCTQRARTKTSKCQAHAFETPKLWEKEMHLLYKVYNTKYFVSVMENRLILLTLSRGLFCQWAILDSGGWQDHVANYCNWICCKRFFGLEKGLFT